MRSNASLLHLIGRSHKVLIASSLVTLLSACASFDGIRSQAVLGTVASGLPSANATHADPLQQWPTMDWAYQFGGEPLRQLIDLALRDHPNLAAADARLRNASALTEGANVDSKPVAQIGYDATYQRFTEHGMVPPPLAGNWHTANDALMKARYEFDFWGKHGAAIRAALSQEKATEAERQSVALALSAAITQTWIQLARQATMQDFVNRQLALRQQLQTLTQQRIAAGLDNESEQQQAKQQIANLEQETARWDEAIALTRNQLAALSGQTPAFGASIALPKAGDLHDVNLSQTLTLDLLSHRPDVAASRWRVESAQGEVDAGKAQFYPDISLNGFAGLSSLNFPHFIDSGSLVAGIGPAIHLPYFQESRLRANLRGKVANYDLAVAVYRQSVLDATHETADQIDALRLLVPQREQARNAVTSANQSLTLAQQRQRAGTTSSIPTLLAQSNLLTQQQQAAELQFRHADLQMKLIKALGGGYSASTPALPAHAPTSQESAQ